VFSVWVGIGAFAGMLALWVHSVVSLAKNYYEQIETIDGGPVEALQSVGANRLQTVAYGVVPQVTLPFISFTIFRWDINVRMATVVGIVGGGGIGDLIFQYQGRASWSEVGLIIMMIAFVVWLMDSLSMSLRKHVA
jgi:phosphonate transport system permease protein